SPYFLSFPTRRSSDLDVHLDVGGTDLHVDFLRLRHDGYGGGGSVDPALCLGGGYALDAVHARFVLEIAEDAIALDGHARVLDPAGGVVARVHEGRLPPFPLRVPQVHSEQILREEACLVPAGSGTHLEDDAAIVVRIAGPEQDLQALVQPVDPRLAPRHPPARH